jgi:hypothetical protein
MFSFKNTANAGNRNFAENDNLRTINATYYSSAGQIVWMAENRTAFLV